MAEVRVVRWNNDLPPGINGTMYELQTDPFDAQSFKGPPDRDWANFVVDSEDAAGFEWRTGTERLLAKLDLLAAGKASPPQLLRNPLVRQWVDSVDTRFCDEIPEEVCEAGTERTWIIQEALERRDEIRENEGPWSYYQWDDDTQFHDAAKSLPLPKWAQYRPMGAGGMGSGYTAAMIILEPGRTLVELGEWLARKEAAPPRRSGTGRRGATATRAKGKKRGAARR